jgi:phage shock protein B
MRALVQLVMVMVIGFMALLVVLTVAGVFMAILLPSLGVAIPELGRELGYSPNQGMDPIASVFVGLVPLVGFALMLLFCLCVVAFVMRMVGREPSRAKAKDAMEETRLIQELYHGMSRMEKRIESLETLLLDRVAPPEFRAAEPRRHTGVR